MRTRYRIHTKTISFTLSMILPIKIQIRLRPLNALSRVFGLLGLVTLNGLMLNHGHAAGAAQVLPPSHAREMAARSVSGLNTLTNRGAEVLEQLARGKREVAKLIDTRNDLQERMEAEMADYRSGQFCSGCDLTRRAIEASGGKFPHPGQKVVRPTKEQIAAKERALRAPIDQHTKRVNEIAGNCKKLAAEKDEIIEQIEFGVKFWSTSVNFEKALIHQLELSSFAEFRSEKTQIDALLSTLIPQKLASESGPGKDEIKTRRIAADIKSRQDASAALLEKRAVNRRKHQAMLTQAESWAQTEVGVINGYTARGTLGLHVSPLSVASANSVMFLGGNQGIYFRLGEASVARHGEVLPAVQKFMNDFASAAKSESPTLQKKNNFLPAQEDDWVNGARRMLREIQKPAPGEPEAIRKPLSNPGGVRS
jgi:hypothetical protein